MNVVSQPAALAGAADAVPGLEILAPGILNTVQDLGRFGLRRFGVSTSGAMDGLALQAGNALLGNAPGAAGLEIQVFPFALRFLVDTAFALTGADALARLDGVTLPPWWVTQARAGQVLRLEQPATGARAYLAVAGGVAVPEVLGSRSTHMRGGFGGHQGRALAQGDVLPVLPASARPPIGAVPPELALPAATEGLRPGELPVRVIRAGEYDRFDTESQAAFWQTAWRITPQSDRGGFRLGGGALRLRETIEMRSHGVVAGVVQVPPAGAPIIQMSDANTAGGYPKIAGVIEADLWRLAQAPLGARLRFVEVDFKAAVDVMAQQRAYLQALRQQVQAMHAAADARAASV